jgi:hypothetical protein
MDRLRQKYKGPFYDSADPETRCEVELEELPPTSQYGTDMPIYTSRGVRVKRRKIKVDSDAPPCGVLVNLRNIQGLFNPNSSTDIDAGNNPHVVHVDAYPLGFLKTAGNIQADGVPHCFYPKLTEINKNVRKNHPVYPTHTASHAIDEVEGEEEDFDMDVGTGADEEDRLEDEGDDAGDREDTEGPGSVVEVDINNFESTPSIFQAVKPVSCQFYNLSTHRVATRAGRHDSQQGTMTAALAGAFAKNLKDRGIASTFQSYCADGLPSERFHQRISIDKCPTACRAELVYSIDLRALKDPSGAYACRLSPLVGSCFSYAIIGQVDIHQHHTPTGQIMEGSFHHILRFRVLGRF